VAPDFQKFMTQATRLTHAGDLHGATALIQQALSQHTFAANVDDGDTVVDVEAREVASTAAEESPCTPLLPLDGTQPALAEAVAGEARFVSGRFGQGRSAREFKLFIPSTAARTGARPLVVMLHGCTQNPDDFAAGTRMNELAQARGIYVLYPAQSRQANPQGCWNWFKASHQQRGRGEPATLAGMTRQIIVEHGIDPSCVYVAGLSAGGAMAAILAQAYPDLFAAVGIHSGVAPGAAKDLPGALAAMNGHGAGSHELLRVPTIVFHGDADSTVHPRNGEQLFAASPGEHDPKDRETVARHGSRRGATRRCRTAPDGRVVAEHWTVHGAAHAWCGGHPSGSHADPDGPDASAEMLRFFLDHRRTTGH
jgi:poly(hydroxyalkanoate) depolymerase family esterase